MSRTQMVGARVPLDTVEEISKAIEEGITCARAAIEREFDRLKGVEKSDG